MAIEVVGRGGPDGTVFGNSDEKIGFYGESTPVAKQSVTQQTGTQTTTQLRAELTALQDALEALGLITVT